MAALPDEPIRSLTLVLRQFAEDRDWDQFHAPKNLAIALSVEASELLEIFQWMPDRDSRDLAPDIRARVTEELADVFLYLVRLADKLDVDLMGAAHSKLVTNALKYPVATARGTSKKYTDF